MPHTETPEEESEMPEPHLRAGDTDREAVAAALGTHMAAGRLTLHEYDERVSQAYAAQTFGQLADLTSDLPALPPVAAAPAPGPSVAAPGPSPVSRPARMACRSWGMPVSPPMASWAWHGAGREHSWRAWLATSVTVLAVYLVISLASWEFSYFWPMWVIGPWGAALLAHRFVGEGRVEAPPGQARLDG